MKYLIIILCFISLHTLARSRHPASEETMQYRKIAEDLLQSQLYFSAAEYAKKYLQSGGNIDENFEKSLEEMVIYTGFETFLDGTFSLNNTRTSIIFSVMRGLYLFKKDKLSDAIKELSKTPDDHVFAAEAKFTYASALVIKGETDRALKALDECIEIAGKFEDKQKNEKSKRYFSTIKENCEIDKARSYFKAKKYKESLVQYDSIPKRSYRWPYIILEKAWGNYYLRDYNRTLGLLVTYKSPLLESYFIPEGEVLNALSYFHLCLWDDALNVIDQYYTVYKPRAMELKAFIEKYNSRSQNKFYELLTASKEDKSSTPYVKNLTTQVKKGIKFNMDYLSILKTKEELEKIHKLKQNQFNQSLVELLEKEITRKEFLINFFIQKQFVEFINEIHKHSQELFKIKLEIMAKKRSLLYKNTQLISDRSRGDIRHVRRKSNQMFWGFKGEFWADELSDYSFGLKSNCEEVKKEKNDE